MAALHIDSENLFSGTRYNGVWKTTNAMSGTYTLISQRFDPQEIPWCWDDTNLIIYGVDDEELEFKIIDPDDLASIQYETDKTVVATYIETRFNLAGSLLVDPYTCTCEYNASANTFTLTFSKEITILWTESPCRGWFNKTYAQDETDTTFTLSANYITTSPRFLYCTIDESPSYYITTNNSYPQLIFSTNDTELTGQTLRLRARTKTLTIQIFLPNVMYSPVPLTGGWDLIFN